MDTLQRGLSSRASCILDEAAYAAKSPDGTRYCSLTPLRFLLLRHLAYLPRGHVATYEAIARAMWPGQVPDPYDGSFDGDIRFHLKELRAILEHLGWPWDVIETVPGIGLRLVLTKPL